VQAQGQAAWLPYRLYRRPLKQLVAWSFGNRDTKPRFKLQRARQGYWLWGGLGLFWNQNPTWINRKCSVPAVKSLGAAVRLISWLLHSSVHDYDQWKELGKFVGVNGCFLPYFPKWNTPTRWIWISLELIELSVTGSDLLIMIVNDL